jgi:hypothetical protein
MAYAVQPREVSSTTLPGTYSNLPTGVGETGVPLGRGVWVTVAVTVGVDNLAVAVACSMLVIGVDEMTGVSSMDSVGVSSKISAGVGLGGLTANCWKMAGPYVTPNMMKKATQQIKSMIERKMIA